MQENRDSDLSISDDEDFDCGSFCGAGKQKQMGLSSKGELEMPVFHNEKSNFINTSRKEFSSNSDEEKISDDEESNVALNLPIMSGMIKFKKDYFQKFKTENRDEACTWSAVLKEAKELVPIRENAGTSSSHVVKPEARKTMKGGRGKTKPKFSIRYQSHKEEPSWPIMMTDKSHKLSTVSQLPEGLGTLGDRIMENSMTGLLENLQEEMNKQSEVRQSPAELLSVGHRDMEHSMAELLEGLQDKNGPPRRTSKMNVKTKGRRLQLSAKRNVSPLGNRTVNNEEPHEPISSRTSSEDEAYDQNHLKLAIPEMKGQTMADRFEDALSAAAASDGGTLFATSKETAIGYHGKLQKVLQIEKERHMEFMKQLETGAHAHDEVRCIDVKILSRYLDAKLTVCHCSFSENTESSQCAEISQMVADKQAREKTIIFSSRICGSVDLDVGNLIRIHPPWKEVKVTGNDESIILCTFFSQIATRPLFFS